MEGNIQIITQSRTHDERAVVDPDSRAKYGRVASRPVRASLAFRTVFERVLLPVGAVIFVPLSFYSDGERVLPYEQRISTIQEIIIGWESLLHISVWPIVTVATAVAFLLAHFCHQGCNRQNALNCHNKRMICRRWPFGNMATAVLCASLFFSLGASIQSQVQIITPSWIWNPFLWGSYKVYFPDDISNQIKGMCLDGKSDSSSTLCLPESSWKALSSGYLSSHNPDDVITVRKGLRYTRQDSFGLVITVLARDTVDTIDLLRKNVEGVVPFVSKLSVVVFENDSSDGTREAFKTWGAEVEGTYTVDVMECPEAVDCVFGISHRYDATESGNYFKSSAVGRMAEFRQRITDYVLSSTKYQDYSHMLVMDVDLGISLSPLGLVHALGKKQDAAVASAARQPWPGSFGTLTPEYDFSAFRAIETPRNRRILWLHSKFCELAPPGDRWRNICDCVSPFQFMLVWGHDKASTTEPFPVASAFNGAILYPLKLVRETDAKYDSGDDGQRCEHIGFNLSLKKPTYVDPKWMMNLKPSKLGGPEGKRALKNIFRIVFSPKISLPIFFQNFGCMLLFVYSLISLGMHAVYPMWQKIMRGTRFQDVAFSVGKGVSEKSGNELDLLMPRKWKTPDCEIAKTV